MCHRFCLAEWGPEGFGKLMAGYFGWCSSLLWHIQGRSGGYRGPHGRELGPSCGCFSRLVLQVFLNPALHLILWCLSHMLLLLVDVSKYHWSTSKYLHDSLLYQQGPPNQVFHVIDLSDVFLASWETLRGQSSSW